MPPFRTLLALHPLLTLGPSQHPALIEDLLESAYASKQGCVDKAIAMISDLQTSGPECRFLKPLFGAVAELKSRTADGGARVYVFRATRSVYGLCRFECKREDASDQTLLLWTAEVAAAYGLGRSVLIGEDS